MSKNTETHLFWDAKPVGLCDSEHPIHGIITTSDTSKTKTVLPDNLFWSDLSIFSYEKISEFISNNYVEDSYGGWRLQYSPEFIEWFFSECLSKIGIIDEKNNLIGMVCAADRTLNIKDTILKTVEINFLCVRKDVKNKRFAPLLIAEVTRESELSGFQTAIYTSGKSLPQKAFCAVRMFHKYLNVNNLVEAGYLDEKNADLKTEPRRKLAKLNKNSSSDFMYMYRYAQNCDIPAILELYKKENCFLKEQIYREKLEIIFSKPNLFRCYVALKVSRIDRKIEIIGFASFSMNKMLNIKLEKSIKCANMFYIYGDITHVSSDILHDLKSKNDVMNCTMTGGKSREFIVQNQMMNGTGILKYYMYNYRLYLLPSEQVMYTVF